jgi:hypothetical protein
MHCVKTLELFPADWRDVWQDTETVEPVGAVFTKPEIVDLILDLAGYRYDGERLALNRLLEPSCGDGVFLKAVVTRLFQSEELHRGTVDWDSADLENAIRAVDLNAASVTAARSLVITTLVTCGCSPERAFEIANLWIVQSDFLLSAWDNSFDYVVGNPPYVRIEDLPRNVLEKYRSTFSTLSDRADLYIAFFERGLELLSPRGCLAFISANRFAKNMYGGALRKLIAERYHVRFYLNLEHTQPFLSDVSAYPAIVVIDKRRGEPTRAGTLADVEETTLSAARKQALGRPGKVVERFNAWSVSGEPWLTTSRKEHDTLSSLSRRLPTLEESAPDTKVGIGVATGADRVFILKERDPSIEEDRQLPLLMAANVANDALTWSGRYVINPFIEGGSGSLVSLSDYPGLAAYLREHSDRLNKRHVAKARPQAWYRTIDRIWTDLVQRPKLVIPDIQSETVIGLDEGQYYPHHNLYWITSEAWPLRALKTLLRSKQVFQQVKAHSVQMRGGSVRFQAQTLRKIRIPFLADLPYELVERLATLSTTSDQNAIDEATEEAFSG